MHPNIHFHKLGISAKDQADDNTWSLATLMAKLNHTGRQVDVFKIDVEGFEYEVFPALLADPAAPLKHVRQLLIEVRRDS